MNNHDRQSWLLRVTLPDGAPNPGRYMAAVLKWLWRRWGVKATAVLDVPPDGPAVAAPTISKNDTAGKT